MSGLSRSSILIMAQLSPAQLEQYRLDGFLCVENYFSPQEMDLLLKIARADQKLAADANERHDVEGRISRLSLRSSLSDDIYSAFVRCKRLVEPMEQLIGNKVFHYHHKMMLKEPYVGGAWEWHQDYGYWYQNFLRAAMASCMIAVDGASKTNGCLQVLKGSHLLGRIEHGGRGDQTGADPERVEVIKQHLETVYCEMEPGTALFFHSNLLHRSDPNDSPLPRWSLICCYSATDNPLFRANGMGQYEPLEIWDDNSILRVGEKNWQEVGEKA